MKPIDNTSNPIAQEIDVEVNQQANRLLHELEIRQYLLFMNRGNGFDGFDFNNDEIIHEKIGTKAKVELHFIPTHRDG